MFAVFVWRETNLMKVEVVDKQIEARERQRINLILRHNRSHCKEK